MMKQNANYLPHYARIAWVIQQRHCRVNPTTYEYTFGFGERRFSFRFDQFRNLEKRKRYNA